MHLLQITCLKCTNPIYDNVPTPKNSDKNYKYVLWILLTKPCFLQRNLFEKLTIKIKSGVQILWKAHYKSYDQIYVSAIPPIRMVTKVF
jgi:hypothetical protein